MDSSVSLKDEIWFLRVCHHISTGLYNSQYYITASTRFTDVRSENKEEISFLLGETSLPCILVRHPCRVFWWDIPAVHFCETSPLCILVRHPLCVFWWDTPAVYFGETSLLCILVRHPCCVFWWGIPAVYFGETYLLCILVRHPCCVFSVIKLLKPSG